jgi:nitroreductase
MEIPASRWYNMVRTRRSRRRFNNEPVTRDSLTWLSTVCAEFKAFPHTRAVLVTESPEPLYKGIIGPYGKIKGATGFIAFIGDMDGPNVQEQTGYTGEGIILEAEALHVATCWVGGFFRKEVVASLIDMKQNEEVLGITPIGYAVEHQATAERLITGFGLTHRRKSLSTIATGLKEADWPVWIKAALEAARLAPSVGNRQPWRFHVEPDSILITVNNNKAEFNISRRLDCGIAMLHIEISALNYGIHGSWEFLEAPRVALFRAGNSK